MDPCPLRFLQATGWPPAHRPCSVPTPRSRNPGTGGKKGDILPEAALSLIEESRARATGPHLRGARMGLASPRTATLESRKCETPQTATASQADSNKSVAAHCLYSVCGIKPTPAHEISSRG